MFKFERIDDFFAYARKRYAIKLEKEAGSAHPLTDDPILQRYSFCNVHREDDKTTRWFRDNVRSKYDWDAELVTQATFIFRWFNRIETGEVLLKHDLFENWHPWKCINALRGREPVVTGAYMVKTPKDMSKLDGVVQCIQLAFNEGIPTRVALQAGSLEAAHTMFMDAPYVGAFVAYELVTDLRHTRVLRDAHDINTWASPGPGAARGLDRLCGHPLGTRRYALPSHRANMLLEMQQLLAMSKVEKMWPQSWPVWELREVEHTLCEYDKYERLRLGEGKVKGRYKGGER